MTTGPTRSSPAGQTPAWTRIRSETASHLLTPPGAVCRQELGGRQALNQAGQLTPDPFFDALAVQVNGPKAWDLDLTARWEFTDRDATYRTTLRNGVFCYTRDGRGDVSLTITVPQAALGALAADDIAAARATGLSLDRDASVLERILTVLQPGGPAFNVIEP